MVRSPWNRRSETKNQELGTDEVIRLTAGHQAKVEEKPEVRKAGGEPAKASVRPDLRRVSQQPLSPMLRICAYWGGKTFRIVGRGFGASPSSTTARWPGASSTVRLAGVVIMKSGGRSLMLTL